MMRPQILPAMLVAFSLVGQQAPKAAATKLTLQIAIESRDFTRAGLTVEEGAFDWNLTAGLNLSKAQDATRFQGLGGSFSTLDGTVQSRSLTVGSTKAFGWGGNLSLSYAPKYSSASGSYYLGTTATPYDGSLSATYTQSLLRNFGRDVTESRLIVARKSAQAADLGFTKAIIDLVASTESLYWDMVFAQRYL